MSRLLSQDYPYIGFVNPPSGVADLEYDTNTNTLILTRSDSTQLTTEIPAALVGFAYISDIVPQTLGDNVGDKILESDGNVLVSCTAGTQALRVFIFATTGETALKPTVYVNDVEVDNLEAAECRTIWSGYRELTISGSTTISVRHESGYTSVCQVTYEAPPAVSSAVFTGEYPGDGQTAYAAGEEVTLAVTSATLFDAIRVEGGVDSATDAVELLDIPPTLTFNLSLTTADQGEVEQAYPVRVSIRNVTGTWSAWYSTDSVGVVDHVNTLRLDNGLPYVVFTGVTYPSGQLAIKDSETAEVSASYLNCDDVTFYSPVGQLYFMDPTLIGTQVVGLTGSGVGAYNVSTPNVYVSAHRVSNNTTQVFNTTVSIADVAASVSISLPASRLRSGVTPQNYTVTISSNQRTLSGITLTASIGTWQGAWTTSDSGVTWTRTLRIADTDAKGAAYFTDLVVTNLAGTNTTGAYSGDTYLCAGFTQRTVSMSAWPNRESDIGTYVYDPSRLRVTNLSKGASGSLNTAFGNSVSDLVDSYTITGPAGVYNPTGRTLYNRDLANAASNTTGLLQYEIEEI